MAKKLFNYLPYTHSVLKPRLRVSETGPAGYVEMLFQTRREMYGFDIE
jgi:hypothetical protein